jgi:CHASE3 domain sensor protein
MIRGFKKVLYTTCILVVVQIVGMGYFVRHSLNQEESYISTLSYDHEVIYVLQGILLSLQRAESNRRGYVITNNREYVQNYNNAVGSVQQSMTYLKQLNTNGQYQDSFLDSLGASINTRIANLKSSIELAMIDSSADSAQAAMTNLGMESMGVIRGTILDLQREKRDSQDSAFQSLGRLNSGVKTVYDIVLIFVVVFAGGIAYLSNRHFRRFDRMEEQLRRELFQARQQVQHATSRYQDLKTEIKEKMKSGDGDAGKIE